ncbi:hypothetical protein [Streptomyces sp. NPDC008001]|uniref:hypothetical protein n=1 Tax=Streptomyces sp. NPDC008001 TaxID=3364804 RepID=UPI0036F0D9A6
MSPEAAEPDSGGDATHVAGGTRVSDVVRDVVALVAPEELLLVDGLAGLDDEAALRRLGRRNGRREPLGFGLGEVAALVTPVVWLALDEAARRIGGAAVEGAAQGARAVLRKVLRRPPAAVPLPELTRDQLTEVHRRVIETAVQRGLGEERALLIADAVVARLALAAPESGTGEPGGPGGPGGPGDPGGPDDPTGPDGHDGGGAAARAR